MLVVVPSAMTDVCDNAYTSHTHFSLYPSLALPFCAVANSSMLY
jgi:hypothetical protein